MRLSWIHLAPAMLGLALAGPALGQDASRTDATPDAREAAAVQAELQMKFPGATISNVVKSAYFGLYEARFDDRMVYTDAEVTYVLVGSVFDANTKQNLTDARLRELTRVTWASLPLGLAFKRVRGKGTRKFAVFADADCPYCRRLEGEIKQLDDVTIYTFLFPLDKLHPDAARKSALIWCAPDVAQAWETYYDSGKLPDNSARCATPIQETARLGQRLRLVATPTLVFADGTMIPGAIPLAQLENEIDKGEAEAKKLAAKANGGDSTGR